MLQAIKGVPVDPNLYEVNPIFEDLLRAVGDQEADLGGTGGATATESNIAASAKSSALSSSIDDIDDTLSAIARAAGQILLLNMSEEMVKQIVGPGAMWPVLTKADVAKEIFLEIEAGSSRPAEPGAGAAEFRAAGADPHAAARGQAAVPGQGSHQAHGRQHRCRRGGRRGPAISVISMNGGKTMQGAGQGDPRRAGAAGRHQQPGRARSRRHRHRRRRTAPQLPN